MGTLNDIIFGYPTAVLSALLGVVLVYWALAMVGLIDFDHLGGDFDLDMDLDGGDGIGHLASALVGFGLGGVPFSVVVSLLLLLAWTLCALYAEWLDPLLPGNWLRTLVDTAVLPLSVVLAIPPTAVLLRPMRRLFVNHGALSNAALVGQHCRILTQEVNEQFGRAEVAGRGTSFNIRVWAHSPNVLARGSEAVILGYDAARACYEVAAAD